MRVTATAGDDATLSLDGWGPVDYGRVINFDAIEVEPTGRRVPHPPTCGACHGAGCPEVRPTTDLRADAWERNEIRIMVSNELIEDARSMQSYVAGVFDRWLRPWLFADCNPMPQLVLFPGVARVQQRARDARNRVRDARQRLRDARYVLRHGLPETDW